MICAIFGTGNVGTALGYQFVKANIPVGIANTRGPDTIAPVVAEIGDCRHHLARSPFRRGRDAGDGVP